MGYHNSTHPRFNRDHPRWYPSSVAGRGQTTPERVLSPFAAQPAVTQAATALLNGSCTAMLHSGY